MQALSSSPLAAGWGRLVAAASQRGLASRLAFAWFIGAALGALTWPLGFGTDQALFSYGGRLLRQGATLYLDFWDIKQPGPYWFYAVAEGLFGPGWQGVCIAYALWLGFASLVGAAILLRCRQRSAAWVLVPLFTVAIAVLRADRQFPAQVEGLVPLPLLGIVWLGLAETGTTSNGWVRWLAAGVLAGVVAVFKLALLPLAVALFGVGLGWRAMRGELQWRTGALAVLCFSASLLAVAAVVAMHFWARGAWTEFVWTTFRYPALLLEEFEVPPLSRPLSSLRWLVIASGLLIPAALRGLWLGVRSWRGDRDVLGQSIAAFAVWFLVATVLIVLQKGSWWRYHMLLLLWPLGMLAAIGLIGVQLRSPRGTERISWWRSGAATAAALALAIHTVHFGWKFGWSQSWPMMPKDRAALEEAASIARQIVPRCGTIYVFGDTNIMLISGLRMALPTHGVFWGAYLRSQKARLTEELAAAQPDLVYLDQDTGRDLAQPATDLLPWLHREYLPRPSDGAGGVWWERRPDRQQTPCPPPAQFKIPPS
jgi:hypothetical protein